VNLNNLSCAGFVILILLMLSIKSEDGKVLEVDRSKFQELTNVIEHAKNTFSMQDDSCLITEPVNGSSVGTLVSSFKTIGNYQKKYLILF
jgi:hypothetical protein